MTKTYDRAYFDKWYRSPTSRVRSAAALRRLVTFVVAPAASRGSACTATCLTSSRGASPSWSARCKGEERQATIVHRNGRRSLSYCFIRGKEAREGSSLSYCTS